MQVQQSKLRHIPEPEWIKRTCETCGGNEKVLHCWRMKGQTGECWYPPGTVKVVDEELNGRGTV